MDFVRATEGPDTPIGHLHRHGGLELRDITSALSEGGPRVRESGPLGIGGLWWVRAGVAA